MALRTVDESSVLEEAVRLVESARESVDISSPWIRGTSLRRVLGAKGSGVRARVLFRVKEPEDLEITDLGALLAFARRGVAIRYSQRLHAKIVVADARSAIVSSSNLTEAAGYGYYEPERRNRELGVVIEDDPEAVAAVLTGFDAAWGEGEWLDSEVVGVVMDFATDREFHIACWRPPAPGSYVAARDAQGGALVGRVMGLTGYNRTFPRMTAGMWATQGYGVAPDAGGKAYEYADLQTLFSFPDKEHGVLGVIAATDPASLFEVAAVGVLAGLRDGCAGPAAGPATPGSLVRRAGADDLLPLLGGGDVHLGRVWHHPEIDVRAMGDEILHRHLAVLGMTGSGKSNALLVLVRELLDRYPNLRVLLIDSHGEYRAVGAVVRPSLVVDVLADGQLKRLLGLAREDPTLTAKVREAAAEEDDFPAALERLATGASGVWTTHAVRLAAICRERLPELCVGGPTVRFDPGWGSGLNVLDASVVEGLEARAQVVGAAVEDVYWRGVRGEGGWLVVVDEAQNYVPEQTTGLLARVRPSFESVFRVVSEGRKFGVGLVVCSQRPARVHKDVLSQCNSHLVFRLANVEDLQAVAGCFETAGRRMLDDLPGLPVGVGLAGGPAFGMPVRVRVPRFEERA